MTRRRRSKRRVEDRLAALETAATAGETLTLTEAEQKAILDTLDALDAPFDPDLTEREQADALIQAGHDRLDANEDTPRFE